MTTYRMYYIDVRDDARVGVTVHHNFNEQGEIINEKEVSVTKL